jgi:hypothetical protein
MGYYPPWRLSTPPRRPAGQVLLGDGPGQEIAGRAVGSIVPRRSSAAGNAAAVDVKDLSGDER